VHSTIYPAVSKFFFRLVLSVCCSLGRNCCKTFSPGELALHRGDWGIGDTGLCVCVCPAHLHLIESCGRGGGIPVGGWMGGWVVGWLVVSPWGMRHAKAFSNQIRFAPDLPLPLLLLELTSCRRRILVLILNLVFIGIHMHILMPSSSFRPHPRPHPVNQERRSHWARKRAALIQLASSAPKRQMAR